MAKKKKGIDAVTKQQVDAILASIRSDPKYRHIINPTPTVRSKRTNKADLVGSFSNAVRVDSPGRGNKFSRLDAETRKIIMQGEKARRQGDALAGEPAKEKKSTFNKIIDFISRGNYAAAAAVDANQEEFRQSRYEGQGFFGSLKDALGAGTKGFGRGLSLKEKKTFSDVLQSAADNDAAVRAGRSPNQSVKGEGKVKGGKFTKGVLGFAGDVLLDPITYTGVGLAGKAVTVGGKTAKSKDIAELVRSTAKQGEKLITTLPNTSAKKSDEFYRMMQAGSIPVERLSRRDKKRLSVDPRIKQVLDIAQAERKGLSYKELARRQRETVGSALNKTSNGHKVKDILDEISIEGYNNLRKRTEVDVTKQFANKGLGSKPLNDYIKQGLNANQARKAKAIDEAKFRNLVAGEVSTRMAKAGITSQRKLSEELIAQVERNASPRIKKSFAIRIGQKQLVDPTGLAQAVAKGAIKVGDATHIRKGLDLFHRNLNANYGITPALTTIRNRASGQVNSGVRAEAMELKSVWDNVTTSQRSDVMDAYRAGALKGSSVRGGNSLRSTDGNPVPVDDAVDYFNKGIQQIQESILMGKFSARELNAGLNKEYQLVEEVIRPRVPTKAGKLTNKTVENPTFLEDFIKKNKNIKDPALVLYQYRAAIARATARRTMNETIAQIHGVPKRKRARKTTGIDTYRVRGADYLAENKGWKTPVGKDGKPLSGMEDFIFEPEIADALSRMDDVFSSKISTGKYLSQYDRALQTFKGLVTKYNPSFHSRTLMGEVMLGYLGGMQQPIRSYKKAATILRGRSQEFLGASSQTGAQGLTKMQVDARNILMNGTDNALAASRNVQGRRPVIRNKKWGTVTSDMVWHHYNNTGLKSGFASTDLMRGLEVNASNKLSRKIGDKSQHLTESVEDFGRMAHFIDVLEHSKARTLEEAVDEAAEIVMKMHLDYTAVTDFERNVASRAIPFYKWVRLSTPLMIEHLLHDPGKVLVMPKAMKMISELQGYSTTGLSVAPGEVDAVVPDYLREAGAMPIGEDNQGNTLFYDPTNLFPLAGSAELTGGGDLLNMLNPGVKIIADLMHGKNKFGPAPKASVEGAAAYGSSLLPQTNLLRQLIAPSDPNVTRADRLGSFLVNPGIQANTPNRMASQALTDRQEAQQRRKRLMEELGIKPKKEKEKRSFR
jgi:hypothetical protein